MYFGSVRFYKHLLLGLLVIVIAGLIFGVCYLSIRNGQLEDEIEELQKLAYGNLPSQSDGEDGDKNAQLGSVTPTPTQAPSPSPTPQQMVYEFDPLPYHDLFDDLYCESDFSFVDSGESVMYLTFNSGPSQNTASLLQKLRGKDIKATFFVLGKNAEKNAEALKSIVYEGHTVGLLGYSDAFRTIYASVDAFLEDFDKAFNLVYDITGVKPTVFRFPGGSINGYNAAVYKEIITEMLRRGFTYYDWNVAAGDDAKNYTTASIKTNIYRDFKSFRRGIILMHETPKTVSALDDVVDTIKSAGYSFDKLTNRVKPVIFAYPR